MINSYKLLLLFLVFLKLSAFSLPLQVLVFNQNKLDLTFKRLVGFPTALNSGYVPPERDPEYRTMIKKSLLQDPVNVIDTLPIPKEGDVVLSSGKWKDDNELGLIRTLRTAFFGNETGWIADVIPLKEGKTEFVYVVDRNAKSLPLTTTDLKPVKYFYVRSENGYRVSIKPNSTTISLRASAYRRIDSTMKLPKKEINAQVLENDMIKYEELKQRLLMTTFQFGIFGSIPIGAFFGLDSAAIYFLGVGFSLIYLILLGKYTDNIGIGYSKREVDDVSISISEKISKTRFLVPLLLVSLIAFSNNLMSMESIQPFQLVTTKQFLAAIGGFLTYRISIFQSEVMSEMKFDDVLGILPGSLAEGYRQFKDREVATSKESEDKYELIYITGPRASGREQIVDDLYKSAVVTNSKIRRWKYFTTDWKLTENNPAKFDYVDEITLNDMKTSGNVLFESNLGTTQLVLSTVGLTTGYKYLLEGPTQLLLRLQKQDRFKLTSVWITAQTREQFVEGAKRISPAEVEDMLDEAVRDIQFYKEYSSMFTYTLLSKWFDTSDDSSFELEQLLKK